MYIYIYIYREREREREGEREGEPEERALLQPKKGTLVTLIGNFSNNREL